MIIMDNDSLKAELAAMACSHGYKDPQVAEFVSANLPTVSLVAETWLKMLDKVPELKPLVGAAKQSNGTTSFFSLYTIASDTATEIIKFLDRTGLLPVPYTNCNAKQLLSVLRYPKRTALSLASWLVKEAKEKFFSSMDHCSFYNDNPDAMLPYRERRYSVIELYKDLIHSWLDEVLPPVEYFNEDADPFTFSPGAVSDACTNPVCKWFRAEHAYADSKPSLVRVIDPIAHRNPVEEAYRIEDRHWGLDDTVVYTVSDVYSVRPITVPKQINSVRTVCPERAYNARLQAHIDRQLRTWWTKHGLDTVFAHGDQEINRLKAKIGSLHGTYATVDFTAASDTVHRDLLYAINHPTLNYLLSFMPQVVVWGNTVRWLDMFGTMGSPLTFSVEQVVFYILGRLAMVLQDFGLASDTRLVTARESGITLVGDDLTIRREYYRTLLALMVELHFIPNEGKSFGEGHFREACGREYVDGVDVSGIYFPRGLVINDSINDVRWDGYKEVYTSPLISLVDHHNELLNQGYSEAAEVILKRISEEMDLGFGLDPLGTWSNTIRGLSNFKFEAPDGTSRFSTVMDIRPNEYVMMLSPTVRWVPTAPKRSCWCTNVPDEVYHMISAEWRMYSHGYSEKVPGLNNLALFPDSLPGGASITLPRVDHARMKPVVSLRLNRHC